MLSQTRDSSFLPWLLPSPTEWQERARALRAEPAAWGTAVGLGVYLIVGARTGLLPIDAVVHLADGSIPMADTVSLAFQALVFGLVILAIWRFGGIHIAFQRDWEVARAASDAMRASTALPLEGEATGGLTAHLLGRLRRCGPPTGAVEQSEFVELFHGEMSRKVHTVGGLQAPCLRLGILGTFLGLALAMLSLEAMDQSFASGELFSALQSCFTTSIAGLLAAMALSTLTAPLRRSQQQVRCLWSDIVGVAASRAPSLGLVPRDMDGVAMSLRLVALNMIEQTATISAQTDTLESGVQALCRESGRVDRFLESLQQIRSAIVQEFASLSEELAIKQWAASTRDALEDVVQGVSNRLERHTRDAMTSLRTCSDSMMQSAEAVETTFDHVGQAMRAIDDALQQREPGDPTAALRRTLEAFQTRLARTAASTTLALQEAEQRASVSLHRAAGSHGSEGVIEAG